jgi:hypothetical protein
LTGWGKRKDGQAYQKDKTKGISGSKMNTSPTSDVHMKTSGMKGNQRREDVIETIDAHDVKMIYGNRYPKGHFFDKDTMAFFDSRIIDTAYKIKPTKAIFFITSEQQHESQEFGGTRPRKWTIRVMNKEGNMDTVGAFQQYESLDSAKRELNKIIEAELQNYAYAH